MHVFFDLDGTLTDSKQGIVACINHALDRLGFEVDDDEQFESYIGHSLWSVFGDLCGDDSQIEAAIAFYRERFADIGWRENRVYDGIEACLEQLYRKTQSIFVVTAKPTVFSQQIIEHFELDRFFKLVYGSNLDGSLGDKADLLAHVLRRENIKPSDAVMIGDRRFDMAAARAHGVASIGVLWGYGSEQELRAAGADRVCAHPHQIVHQLFG